MLDCWFSYAETYGIPGTHPHILEMLNMKQASSLGKAYILNRAVIWLGMLFHRRPMKLGES
jgi:hypothetical protein